MPRFALIYAYKVVPRLLSPLVANWKENELNEK
jgi:hypothetical protein